jgi:hypothetical protein
MELVEFLLQIRATVQAEIGERLTDTEEAYPYPEVVFAETVMQHMAEIGMSFDPQMCYYANKVGNAQLKLSGYALSDDAEQLDLFVSLFANTDTITNISDSETKQAAEQCLRFLARCAEGKMASAMDDSHDAYPFAVTIQECYSSLDQIRIFVLTDCLAKSKSFKSREISGRTVKLEVMDIERLYRHLSEGKPRDELVVNFEEVSGCPLPCVYVPGNDANYDYAMTAIPAEALRFLYEKYGARLLEANVRSFLNTTGKVNKGIRDTLKNYPERFMAYNNGIVVVADEISVVKTSNGETAIHWLKGMQIVNGGQTTASIYFTKKKWPEIDLRRVRVPAKLIILRSLNSTAEESLISDISRYANSQNAVKQSDLSANLPFHIELEKIAQTTYCPDGVGKWFYERAAGSYNTYLAREGDTPARLKRLREIVTPPARKITKTDLAKVLNAWNGRPHIVSFGAQKNFEKFMEEYRDNEAQAAGPLPDVSAFKSMVAKIIIFKKVTMLVRPMFPAFQGNVATYLVSVLADQLRERIDLGKIWIAQDISPELKELLKIWAAEVNEVLHKSSAGRMISEWAKKPECWDAVRSASYTVVSDLVPEFR